MPILLFARVSGSLVYFLSPLYTSLAPFHSCIVPSVGMPLSSTGQFSLLSVSCTLFCGIGKFFWIGCGVREMIQSNQVEMTEERKKWKRFWARVCYRRSFGSATQKQRQQQKNKIKIKIKKRGRKDGRKEGKGRTTFRTCIYSERLLGGARQGRREIREGQR